jgi:hypothetical protein
MVDRQDLDALLIGSLYGELSSADEARLRAHLESHPADRAALEGLTRTREAVRSSRLFEAQLDPPQSVSARLVQEAARRAPRAGTAQGAGESWFVRLRRSFLMHPAMATAAMLVVVVGVAGTIYMRRGDHFAAPELSSSGPAAEPDSSIATAAQAPATPASVPAAAAAVSPPAADPTPPPAKPNTASSDTSFEKVDRRPNNAPKGAQGGERDSFRVGITDGARGAPGQNDGQDKAKRLAAEDQAGAGAARPASDDRPDDRPVQADRPKLARPTGGAARLEIAGPQRAPKDLDEESEVVRGRAQSETRADRAEATAPPPPTRRSPPAPAPAPAPASASPPASMPMPPAAPEPAPPAESLEAAKAPAAAPSANVVGAGGVAQEKKLMDGELAWARDQHARLVTQVRAGQCNDAATTALALSSRAPGYYQQNVATDRSVKDCLVYINAERERAEQAQRARAAMRRASDEAVEPSVQPSLPKKAAATKAAAPRPTSGSNNANSRAAPAPANNANKR